ncbi:Xndc1-transient receptor potential cation channel, subfamily C, member 2 readthrough [Apodemus speciosus]|uniref:Xndc1-transient receptor potential cation channel, subfamily C, member 2 readthrough n=1 Tax=Apodemus speciosus TaxID=105296 RepID=A0ABQ0EZR1_APOSI
MDSCSPKSYQEQNIDSATVVPEDILGRSISVSHLRKLVTSYGSCENQPRGVIFFSEDPKYPVENLLSPDSHRGPWLSCPRDKTRQLQVELQLERAVPISYIDVVIDVGRSSWPLDRPFVTLLPATMLMSLTDSKEGKNRSGVRMFKNDDFLTPTSGESWDRLRLTCSQPFTRHQSFGLAFLRVRSSLDSLADPVMDPSAPGSSGLNQNSTEVLESDSSPWLTNPSIRRTFFPDPQMSTKEISELKGMLKQLQPGPLGRAARMVLSAARKAPPASVVSPNSSHREPGPSNPESAAQSRRTKQEERCRQKEEEESAGTSECCCPAQVLSQLGGGQEGQGKGSTDLRPKVMTVVCRLLGSAPFAQCSFSMETLPRHAATCGESSPPQPASPASLSSSESVLWVSSPESSPPPPSWVQCPICELQFSAREIEEHASMCGDGFPA